MIKHFAMLAAICTMAFANTAAADEDDNPDWSKQQQQAAGSSGLGESCRRKTDCKEGLKCVRRVCTDPHEGETCGATADCGGGDLKCINDKCTNPNASGGSSSNAKPKPQPDSDDSSSGNGEGKPETKPAPAGDWMKFRLDDGQMHPFVGIVGLVGGFAIAGATPDGAPAIFEPVSPAFLFALKAGLILGGRHELAVELTPFFTALPSAGALTKGPVFEINASYGYLIPVADHVSWPLRLGLGLMAGPSPNAADSAWFQIRADLIGVQINVAHLLIDLHLPSFRYFLTDLGGGQRVHILDWVFGASFGYAF
jgi:hypothetical protein